MHFYYAEGKCYVPSIGDVLAIGKPEQKLKSN
jgi:hypothetical protein